MRLYTNVAEKLSLVVVALLLVVFLLDFEDDDDGEDDLGVVDVSFVVKSTDNVKNARGYTGENTDD